MKKIILIFLAGLLIMALAACGSPKNSAAASAEGAAAPQAQSTADTGTVPAASTGAESNQEKSAVGFSVEPVSGWRIVKGSETTTFKAYTLLEPYIGTGAFWMSFILQDVLDGNEKSIMEFFDEKGWDGIEIQSLDKMTVGSYQAVRCVMTSAAYEGQTQAHYYIDIEGDQDIYFQLTAPKDKFSESQTAWEEALKTLKAEY